MSETKKVRFLKNHLHYKQDSEADAAIGMANYWERVGVCEILGDGGDSSSNGFDPAARKKELLKLKRTELNNVGASHELDPLSFKNKPDLADAIVLAETPVVVTDEEE